MCCNYLRSVTPHNMADKNRVIVLQGKVKILGEQYHATWSDTVLTLFSDSSIEYETNNAKQLVKVGPSVTASRSNRLNYPEVFLVNTRPESDYSCGPMFSTTDVKDTDEWITKINKTRLLWSAANATHPHPLTRATNAEEYHGGLEATSIHFPNAMKCKLCNNQAWHGYVCEYCDDFIVCDQCEADMARLSEKIVKSPNHEHPLMKFPLAMHDPTDVFNSNYNGYYNCDQCKTDQSDEVYHCLTCEVYDECPSCATGIKKSTSVAHTIGNIVGNVLTGIAPTTAVKSTVETQSQTNPTHLELKHLAAAMYAEDPNMYSLKEKAKVPIGSSLISNKHWNLSNIETQPATRAYMEVTFNKFAPNSFVGVGLGNQIWKQNQMLGLQQNSYGYFNNGTVAHNIYTQEESYFPGFEAGDTIGVGILYDSYNQRRLFFTKNGKMLGNFPAVIHKGMDCFPGVSFKNDSGVSFSVTMSGPFKFDLQSIPSYYNDKSDRMRSVPDEIVAGILSYVATSLRLALELRFVNKKFSQLAFDNMIWKPLFLAKWPMQNSKLKLKSWYTLYKRRSGATATQGQGPQVGGPTKSYIENCDFEFQCPLLWEAMKKGKNENERFCDKCQKTVYSVSDEATLQSYAEMGRCVSFVKKVQPIGPMIPPPFQRLGGAPRPQPRSIPPPPK